MLSNNFGQTTVSSYQEKYRFQKEFEPVSVHV